MKFLEKRVAINTDPKNIEAFLTRGVEKVFPSKEVFAKTLGSGKKLSIYLGIDPTGPTLHMGHVIPIMKLAKLQEMGHKVILLMGDFTAMIGDPTDKSATRKKLTREEVLSNLKLYKKQASKFLSFSGQNAAEIKYNSKWLGKMSFGDVLELASNMTVQQMIERDMFTNRMKEGKPIYVHEFLYPLMQGYDSVAMDVDAEVGGNDQTFNMLTGRNLMRSLKNKEKFVLTTKLLVDATGKKMGKSEGNMITLLDSAQDVFGKIMSNPDSLIIPSYELCTKVSDEEIEKEKQFLEKGGNPKEAKMRLAFLVTEMYHGTKEAVEAQKSFTQAFSKSASVSPSQAPETECERGVLLSDVLVREGIVSSKTEFKRLVTEKAIKDLTSGKSIDVFDAKLVEDMDLKVGKHRFIKIKIK